MAEDEAEVVMVGAEAEAAADVSTGVDGLILLSSSKRRCNFSFCLCNPST
jgi:hypothetical protein